MTYPHRRHPRRTPSAAAAATVVVALLAAAPARAAAAPAAQPPPPPQAPAPRASPAAVLPSMEDIRVAYATGRYDEALRKLQPVLTLTGKAAEGYDRHALLLIQAETLLRMRSTSQAAAAFAAAAREAPDPAAAAVDQATALLVRRSSAGSVYQPRARAEGQARLDGRERPAVDILAADARKDALRALFADELAARRAEVEAAADPAVRTLDKLAPALAAARDLRVLELAGTGGEDVVSDLVAGLDVKVASLLRSAMDAASEDVREAKQQAADLARAPRYGGGGFLKRPAGAATSVPPAPGLPAARVAAVRDAIATCEATIRWCDDAESAFKGGSGDFKGLRDEAKATGSAAANLLGRVGPGAGPRRLGVR